MTEIVKIDPKEFGLEESKASEIAAQFKPMLDKMIELETEFNEIANLPIEDLATSVKAKTLRLKYVKVRTGTAEIHRTQKDFYLSGGRFVDGWKNAQLFASQGIEKKLEAIELFAINKEKERIAALQSARELQLSEYNVENLQSLNLGAMSNDVFENFLLGTKTSFENKVAAEKLVEETRLAAIEAKRIEDERIRKENEELRLQAVAKQKEIDAANKKAADELAEVNRIAEAESAKQRKLLSEQKAKADALANQLKAKADAEAKELKERKAAEKKAAAAPDKEKLIAFAVNIDSLILQSQTIVSEDANHILSDAKSLLQKVSNFIREKSESL